jgi:hypothetical protein
MENAREEWDRAHATYTHTKLTLEDYKRILREVGEAVVFAAMVDNPPKYVPQWDEDLSKFDKQLNGKDHVQPECFTEIEDNDLLTSLLEVPEVIEEWELEPLPDVDYRED